MGLHYFRLHGSPRASTGIYHAGYLARLASAIADLPVSAEVWVIFDNTALGHGFRNALDLQALTHNKGRGKSEGAKPKLRP